MKATNAARKGMQTPATIPNKLIHFLKWALVP